MTATLRHARTAMTAWWLALLILGGWQLWINAGHVAKLVAPAPRDVIIELVSHPAVYLTNGGITLLVAFAGLSLGTLLGCGLAVLTWFSPLVTGAITLPAILVQSTPLVALMPVVARLLGYDWHTVVAAATLITFFPTFVLVAAGLRTLPPGAADVFGVLGAGRLTRLRLLVLPAAIPSVLVALRISSANSIVAALVAEYLMGTAGLGRLFATSESTFDTAAAWAACFVATAISVTAFLSTRRIEHRFARDFVDGISAR